MLSFLFFDASGTILLPHPSIGAIYSDVARSFGVEAEPELLEQGFVRVFRAARHARGLERLPYGSTHEEARAFWRPIVAEAFAHAGLSMPPDPYFDTVYDRFATRHAWRLDDGFSEALQLLRDAGVGVGLLSNFDPRLRPLLHDLDIAHHFEAIVISCEHAAEKPSAPSRRSALPWSATRRRRTSPARSTQAGARVSLIGKIAMRRTTDCAHHRCWRRCDACWRD
jgi:putative hydrolase of the HAD superfamily